MLISKFNKLIHNKIIWAVFAVLISLAMVGMFAPSGASRGRTSNRNNAGTLFGEPISRQEFNLASVFSRGFQPRPAADEVEKKRIDEEVWQRLAILQLAKQMNISVSNSELNENIQRDPSFAVNGVFSKQRYQQLIEQQMRVRVTTFEEYLRQELILRKMSAMVIQSIWVSPSEIERSVSRLTDLFTIQIADLTFSNSVSNVEASDEEIQNYYDEHTNTFEISEMRSVKYVEWPISNYLADVSISEETIQEFYDDNLTDFASVDTNGTVTYVAFDDVTNSIRSDIAWKKAIGMASESAMQFYDDLSEIDYGKDVNISIIAKQHNCTVQTTSLFSENGEVDGLDVGDRFKSAAFRLDAELPEDSYSHTIVTDNAIYLLSADKTEAAHIPAFEDVKEEVKLYADSLAKSTAFNEKATEIQEKLAASAATSSDIIALAKKLKLTTKTPEPFSVYEESLEDESISAIAPAILGLNKNEVSDAIPTAAGVSIVYVVDREPGDFALAESLKPDVARSIQSRRMRAHFESWAKGILTEARATESE